MKKQKQNASLHILISVHFSHDRYGGLSFGERNAMAFTGNISAMQSTLERLLTAANNGSQVSLNEMSFLNNLSLVLPALASQDVGKVGY